MRKRKVLEELMLVFLPIFLGAVLYYIFCPETIFVEWVDNHLNISYHMALNYESKAVVLLRYYLFDILWAYSLMLAVLLIIRPPKEKLLQTFLLVLFFEIIMESLQLLNCVKGTFDICDILLEAITNVLVITFFKRRISYEKEN